MFSKRASRPVPPPSPPPPPAPPPPKSLVEFDTNETRDFVRSIIEVAAASGGAMRVRLASQDGWQVLPKQLFEVRFRLTEITYSAWYSASHGEPEYYPRFKCRLVCRPLGHTTPLIVFLPDDPDEPDEPPDAAKIYTCQFSEVSIQRSAPDPHVAADALVPVRIWDSEEEAHKYQDELLVPWQAAREGGAKAPTTWPNFQLNTRSNRWRRDPDDPPLDSYLQLPPNVFEGLRRDLVAMGNSVHVEVDALIEAYVLHRKENFRPEFGDGKYFADLVLVPFGAVLSAMLEELNVNWREGGTDHRSRMNPPPYEEAAKTLDGLSND